MVPEGKRADGGAPNKPACPSTDGGGHPPAQVIHAPCTMYPDRLEGRDGGMDRGKVAGQHRETLAWDKRFAELVVYKEKNGNCNVPQVRVHWGCG